MHRGIILAVGYLIPSLFFSFPLVLGLSNVLLLFILIGFCLTFSPDYFKSNMRAWPGLLLLVLFCVVLIGTLYTSAPWEWVAVNLGKYAKFIYAVALMLLFIRFPEWQRKALYAFILAMLFILASTWLNVWFILPWSVTKLPGWGLSHHVFGDYITQNVMMTFLVIFALSNVTHARLCWKSIFWMIVAILGAISITHLSFGRTGVLLLVSGLLTYMVIRWKGPKLWIGLPTLLLLLATVIASSSVMRDRIELGWKEFAQRDVDVMSAIGQRAYNYKIVPQLIAEKPIAGHGTGAYHTEICRFVDKPEWCDIFRWHSHNQFLFFGADHGLIGIFVYIALLLSLFHVASKSVDPQAKLLLATLASILVVDSMFNTPLYSARESHFFLYMMALLVAMCRPVRIEANQGY